jgi:signal transduction histidine kinase
MIGSLIERVLQLLATDVGNLAYHLVLAFSVAAALQLAFSQGARAEPARLRRSVIGLSGLLVLQLGLFIAAGLGWQGLINAPLLLPSLDRAVTLLGLVVIAWLWCFPDPSPSADAGAFLLGFFAVVSAILGALWWSNQGPEIAFNGSWLDIAAQAAGLFVILIGCLVLIYRRPDGWTYGVPMLLLVGMGSILHLLLLPYGEDYAVAVRLGQIAAYPFLLILPQRNLVSSLSVERLALEQAADGARQSQAVRDLYADPQLWQAMLKLAGETDTARISQGIVSTLANALEADLCLMFQPPDSGGKILMSCGYDRNARRTLESLEFDSRALPMFASSLRMGRARRFAAASTSPDLANLARTFNLERTGNLLFVPVLSRDGHPVTSLALLSPYSGRDWSQDELSFLVLVARFLVQFLQRSQEMNGMSVEVDQTRQMLRMAQEQAKRIQDERQKLSDQYAVLQEDARQKGQKLTSMANMATALATARGILDKLQAENKELKEAARLVAEEPVSREQPVEGELRLALQEIAYLKLALIDADRKIDSLRLARVTTSITAEQMEKITSIAQDLRQPLSSIVGYIDFLLGESMGILGAAQRKYLERAKVSTERINRLVDDLILATTAESNISQLEFAEVDLRMVINRAILEADEDLKSKHIALEVEMPEEPLQITTDGHALRRVFGQLLHNAGAVTPEGGGVQIKARQESTESEQDYVLVQVTDGGGGIDPQDIPRVFSIRNVGTRIAGISEDGAGLVNVKTLVEVLGGRAWVDSDTGHGAIFSVLLPTHPEVPGRNGNGAQE